MAKRDADTKDPRFRPFRVTAYLTYIVVVVVFSSLIIFSVVRSVLAMTPPRLPESSTTLTVAECLERAEGLWRELEGRRKSLGDHSAARQADSAWPGFRRQWLERHRQAEAVCALESKQRVALKEVFTRLERAMDLHTTHAVQYAGEIGPTVDAMRQAMNQARKDAAR
ncbi:MAG: hypothetical protein ACYC8T_20485 [Myxococcaceae bacterium]